MELAKEIMKEERIKERLAIAEEYAR